MWLQHAVMAASPLLRPYWRLRLVGAVDRIPRTGPLIVAPNHGSFFDPWFIMMVFPRPIRYLITAQWYYKSRAWNAFLRAWGPIPVHDEEPRQTLRAVCEILDQGSVCGIFPEGKISFDGRVQRFRSGLARVAGLSGAPVVPIGIRGNFRSLPRSRRFPAPTRVTVHVGEPVVFPGSPYSRIPPRAETREFLRHVFEAVCRLAGQEERIRELDRASAPSEPVHGSEGPTVA